MDIHRVCSFWDIIDLLRVVDNKTRARSRIMGDACIVSEFHNKMRLKNLHKSHKYLVIDLIHPSLKPWFWIFPIIYMTQDMFNRSSGVTYII